MKQGALFSPHETLYDAIGADIAACGGFKVVAGKLWPSDPRGDAKLRNSLNTDQPHKLDPQEVLQIKRMARELGSTAAIDFEAMQCGYQVTWVNPRDEAAELQRKFVEGASHLSKMLERYRLLQETTVNHPALKAVRP